MQPTPNFTLDTKHSIPNTNYMIIITGGAGLIGSAILWALNEHGNTDVIIVDEIDHDAKERNLSPLKYEQLIGIKEFRQQLNNGDFDDQPVEAIIHMGACSDTTETDWDFLADNNVAYSKDIIRWCADHNVRCIYASSAATYGDGANGYDDDPELFNQLEPLNLYGKSKLLVDIWARDGGYLEKAVGLRYFNVFGPNENHKEHMRSVIAKKFTDLKDGGVIELFKSAHPDFKDGEQMRDFIYVKDAVAATLFFLENKDNYGVFNVGTGKAQTWKRVANAMFKALGQEPNIQFVDMPAHLKKQYQYFTEANITRLKDAGYKAKFTPLEEGIADYIRNYLDADLHLGETK